MRRQERTDRPCNEFGFDMGAMRWLPPSLLFLGGARRLIPPGAQLTKRPAMHVTGYVIDAELDTTTYHISAKAVVSFTAPANLEVVSFGFHPALKVTKITDQAGKLLDGERTAMALRVTPVFLRSRSNGKRTFEYEGSSPGMKRPR